MTWDSSKYTLSAIEATCVLIPAVLSCFGSLWLLLRLSRLTRTVRGYLFPRQMWHLALADLFTHAAMSILIVVDLARLGGSKWHKDLEESVCEFVDPVFRFTRNVAVMAELHISAGFAFHGKPTRMKRIADSMRWIWHCGLLLAVLEVYEVFATYDDRKDFGLCPNRPHCTWIVIILILATFLVTQVFNVVAVCAARRAMSNKFGGNVRRAAMYSAAFFIGYAPTFVGFGPFHVDPTFTEKNAWYFAFEYGTESLNGVMNFATYALQSRYAAALFRQAVTSKRPSVHFHMANEVGFAGVSVIEVLPLTEAAAMQAELDLAALEDRGYNGYWLDDGETAPIQICGTRINWQERSAKFKVMSQNRLLLDVGGKKHYADFDPDGDLLNWADGSVWRRIAPLESSPHVGDEARRVWTETARRQTLIRPVWGVDSSTFSAEQDDAEDSRSRGVELSWLESPGTSTG